jgi:hypothetical protein
MKLIEEYFGPEGVARGEWILRSVSRADGLARSK